jgi:hypothetical protein
LTLFHHRVPARHGCIRPLWVPETWLFNSAVAAAAAAVVVVAKAS